MVAERFEPSDNTVSVSIKVPIILDNTNSITRMPNSTVSAILSTRP
jgi:hypothetical protein